MLKVSYLLPNWNSSSLPIQQGDPTLLVAALGTHLSNFCCQRPFSWVWPEQWSFEQRCRFQECVWRWRRGFLYEKTVKQRSFKCEEDTLRLALRLFGTKERRHWEKEKVRILSASMSEDIYLHPFQARAHGGRKKRSTRGCFALQRLTTSRFRLIVSVLLPVFLVYKVPSIHPFSYRTPTHCP